MHLRQAKHFMCHDTVSVSWGGEGVLLSSWGGEGVLLSLYPHGEERGCSCHYILMGRRGGAPVIISSFQRIPPPSNNASIDN